MNVKEFIKAGKKFRRQVDSIHDALCCKQSNARAERMNGNILEIRMIGRGYRIFETLGIAILFLCGGLDLYLQGS